MYKKKEVGGWGVPAEALWIAYSFMGVVSATTFGLEFSATWQDSSFPVGPKPWHWVNLVKATVPVAVDVGFKFVVFFYMQRKTQVIMREMNDF